MSFCASMLPVVSFFCGGEAAGGGVPSSSLSSLFFVGDIFGGEVAVTVTANGGDRVVSFSFLDVFNSVYSSFFFISMRRFIDCTVLLSYGVCFLYRHQANSAAQECCTLFVSTNAIYSNRVSFSN